LINSLFCLSVAFVKIPFVFSRLIKITAKLLPSLKKKKDAIYLSKKEKQEVRTAHFLSNFPGMNYDSPYG
jgi:hypothetical protein